jgi:hypothetical protein
MTRLTSFTGSIIERDEDGYLYTLRHIDLDQEKVEQAVLALL